MWPFFAWLSHSLDANSISLHGLYLWVREKEIMVRHQFPFSVQSSIVCVPIFPRSSIHTHKCRKNSTMINFIPHISNRKVWRWGGKVFPETRKKQNDNDAFFPPVITRWMCHTEENAATNRGSKKKKRDGKGFSPDFRFVSYIKSHISSTLWERSDASRVFQFQPSQRDIRNNTVQWQQQQPHLCGLPLEQPLRVLYTQYPFRTWLASWKMALHHWSLPLLAYILSLRHIR